METMNWPSIVKWSKLSNLKEKLVGSSQQTKMGSSTPSDILYNNVLCQWEQVNGKEKLVTLKKPNKPERYVSSNQVKNLGEVLIGLIASGDRDGLGKKGQNKGLTQREDGSGYDLFGFDFGKSYERPSPFMKTLKDDFTFVNPTDLTKRMVNATLLYDNPLSEKMKGVYLIAAFRGKLTDEALEAVALSYEKRGAEDAKFARKLRNAAAQVDEDIQLIQRKMAMLASKKDEKNDTQHQVEFDGYLQALKSFEDLVVKTDNDILDVFKARLGLTPDQLDMIDNLEKLTSLNVQTLSEDGKVYLRHIQVPRVHRVAWQLEKTGATYQLKAFPPKNQN